MLNENTPLLSQYKKYEYTSSPNTLERGLPNPGKKEIDDNEIDGEGKTITINKTAFNTRDYTGLYRDIWPIVFRYIDDHELTIRNMRLVSKAFNRMVREMPYLFDVAPVLALKFLGAGKSISIPELLKEKKEDELTQAKQTLNRLLAPLFRENPSKQSLTFVEDFPLLAADLINKNKSVERVKSCYTFSMQKELDDWITKLENKQKYIKQQTDITLREAIINLNVSLLSVPPGPHMHVKPYKSFFCNLQKFNEVNALHNGCKKFIFFSGLIGLGVLALFVLSVAFFFIYGLALELKLPISLSLSVGTALLIVCIIFSSGCVSSYKDKIDEQYNATYKYQDMTLDYLKPDHRSELDNILNTIVDAQGNPLTLNGINTIKELADYLSQFIENQYVIKGKDFNECSDMINAIKGCKDSKNKFHYTTTLLYQNKEKDFVTFFAQTREFISGPQNKVTNSQNKVTNMEEENKEGVVSIEHYGSINGGI